MAGSINLANVAIGFDASKITRGVDLSAGEMRKLNGIIKESISPMDRYNADLTVLEKAHKAGAVSADRMKQAVASLQEKYKQGVSSSSTNSMATDLKSTLAQYAGMAAAFQGLKKSMSLAAAAETNKISLEVLTGSAQKAQMLFDGFIELDRSSPLSRSDFARASQTLLGYGYAAESTLPTLKALSEVSVGNADRFQSLSLAFGQVTANGRLMGQEVLQMVNAGFNPLQEISRTTGRSMVELKQDMEAGAISSRMVEDAFKSATSEGGRFYEMNERLKNSAAGQFAKMQSDVEMLATEIGTSLLPAAKALMDLLSSGGNESGEQGLAARWAETFSVGAEGLIYALTLNQDKFDAMMNRLEDQKMAAEMQIEAGVHKQTPEEKERVAAAIARRMAKEREELEAIAKKEKEAADAKAKTEKEASDRVKEAAAEKKRIAQQEENERKKRAEDMIRDAEKLKEATATPLEKYKAEIDKLQSMIDNGAIDQETFDRAEKQLGEKFQKDNEPDKKNIDLAIAPTLAAGSVEAYKFMNDQKNEEMEVALRQEELQIQQVELNKQQLEAIKEIQPIGRAR
jgi:tape measure domain-containing protein